MPFFTAVINHTRPSAQKRRRESETLQWSSRMLGHLTKYTGTKFSLKFITVGGRVVHE